MTAEDMAHKQWLAGVFDRAAPTYDRVGDSYHDHFGTRMVDVAGIGEGSRVLDVACGRGAVLLPAAERVGEHGSVVGVELSPEMARQARAAALGAGLDERINVWVMDAEHLEFPDDAFDAVLCAFGVFFFPHPAQAAAEFVRVVAPGGLVGVSAWAAEDERWAWNDQLLSAFSVSRRAITRSFDQPRDLERLLGDAGLAEVRSDLQHNEILFASEEQWWDWHWSYSIRGVLEQVDDDACDRYRRAAFQAMQPLRSTDGFSMRLTATFAFGRKP